ncbi:MAG: glutamate-1-semialdehyde 2,1-aminomutase [Candidatus Hinthialibacter antarcticus]|nr:glutamate-1-semialdehyde 2,1-aminomutase [Candidatus Hinthialibacter antarcticus]
MTAVHKEARQLIPGGVNSPVRAWNAVGGDPFFAAKGKGCLLFDSEGKQYVDYVCSWGPLILGHAHPVVVKAVQEAAADGLTFGCPTEREVTLARLIVDAVPSVEMVRLVNSGTEATLSAIRLARGFTGRDKIIKMVGGYHGHHDALLASAGSGVATLAIPSTPGVPASVVQDTLLVPFNNASAVEAAFNEYADSIACVIVEPVAGNMGVVPPKDGYLQALRSLCSKNDALLIFDEVMTGFRVSYGGAQELYGVTPDLCTLGKIVGGGMPMGAYGGRADIMKNIAPEGSVYQAGTLSGNPVATACGLATLEMLKPGGFYDALEEKSRILEAGLFNEAEEAGVPIQINRVGSMMTVFFSETPVTDFDSAAASDTERFGAFWRGMLKHGVYLPPSAFEAWFVSAAHSNIETERTLRAAGEAFKTL